MSTTRVLVIFSIPPITLEPCALITLEVQIKTIYNTKKHTLVVKVLKSNELQIKGFKYDNTM
jgi:hypothetical protein